MSLLRTLRSLVPMFDLPSNVIQTLIHITFSCVNDELINTELTTFLQASGFVGFKSYFVSLNQNLEVHFRIQGKIEAFVYGIRIHECKLRNYVSYLLFQEHFSILISIFTREDVLTYDHVESHKSINFNSAMREIGLKSYSPTTWLLEDSIIFKFEGNGEHKICLIPITQHKTLEFSDFIQNEEHLALVINRIHKMAELYKNLHFDF